MYYRKRGGRGICFKTKQRNKFKELTVSQQDTHKFKSSYLLDFVLFGQREGTNNLNLLISLDIFILSLYLISLENE